MPSGPSLNAWASGAGGGGGGGAVALRAGNALSLGAISALRAAGGSAGSRSSNLVTSARPAPGGGGSGGSIVLQSGGAVDLMGEIDVRGGAGGDLDISTSAPYQLPQGAAVHTEGGDGGDGFVRLELPGSPTTALLPGMQPAAVAANVAPLVEVDPLASMQSRFYPTYVTPGPSYVRYVVEALVDGVPRVFSDDPSVSLLIASVGAPLQIWLQGARLDPLTMDPIELGPWRPAVRSAPGTPGLDADDFEAFRFRLVVDRTLAASVTVQRVQVVYSLDR